MDRGTWWAAVHGVAKSQTRLSRHTHVSFADSPGKNTGVGCHALQGVFPAQGSNPRLLHLLHWQVGSLPLAPTGKSYWIRQWIANTLCW